MSCILRISFFPYLRFIWFNAVRLFVFDWIISERVDIFIIINHNHFITAIYVLFLTPNTNVILHNMSYRHYWYLLYTPLLNN